MLISLAIYGCNYTKRVGKGEYLVEKNTIDVQGEKISQGELQAVLKTQPNRKIFGRWRFHLWLYNIPDTVKMNDATDKKHQRITKRAHRRGHEPDTLKLKKLAMRDRFGRWLKNSVGEAPVLLDSSKVRASTKNLSNYLFKKGYFDNRVRDSIALDTVNRKAYLYFFIRTYRPYSIDTLITMSEDKKLLKVIKSASDETLIKKGNLLDIDVLDAERTRLITYLKDRGYYEMNKDFFSFKIDSTFTDHRVKLTMSISRVLRKVNNSDSTFYENHKRYMVNNIYIFTDFSNNDSIPYDTRLYDDHIFMFHGRPSMRPSNLLGHIYINKGYYYRAKEVESTYKKLTSLGIYKSTNITFKPNTTDPNNPLLDCFIMLKPLPRQTYRFEAKATNRSGNFGVAGNIFYGNKNLFHGAENLKISLVGGLEVQQLLTNQDDANVGDNVEVAGFKPLNTFNTIEFGPEISLSIPKFLVPFNVFKFSKNASPKTVFATSLNFQQRPDFTRGIQEASLGYEWVTHYDSKKKKGENEIPLVTMAHYLSPLKLSAVKINPSPEFELRLNTIKDPFLRYSYTDHILLGCQYQMTLNIQRRNPNKDQVYIKWGIEQSGNLMRAIFEQSNQKKDSIGSYEILGIGFSQFFKTDIDFRYKINFNKSSQLVYRTAAGVGVPLANSKALPFEKSFYVGGSNGLRAFRARSIGPGGYYDTTVTFDKIGDILLEGNIEYRFDLLKIIKGALFFDAGNVWLINSAGREKPKAEISPEFYKQLAMGAGVGLRIDLDFFLFRFDFAYPLRQPGLPDGEKWFFQEKTIVNTWLHDYAERNGLIYKPFKSKLILNIGIGYPF